MSSLFLKILGGGNKEVDGKVVNSKVVYGKNAGSGKAFSKKISGFLVDFTLSLLLLSTELYKEHFSIFFKIYISYRHNLVLKSLLFRNKV